MALLAIGRRIGLQLSRCRREPTITEILSDSVVKAVMEAEPSIKRDTSVPVLRSFE